jgi:hypothetical protein
MTYLTQPTHRRAHIFRNFTGFPTVNWHFYTKFLVHLLQGYTSPTDTLKSDRSYTTMVVKEEYATIDGPDIGLDRADINRQGQIEIPNQAPQPSHDHREDDEEEERKKQSSLHRVRVSLSEKKHDAGLKIRKKLHISKMTDTDVDDDLGRNDSVLANPVTEESESRLSEKLPVPDKATMKDFLHSPIDTTKDKISGHGNQEVAANIAAREISHGQDVDLLNAHKKMQNADTTQEREKAAETFEELMKERQNMFVRWTLDRHITKARILPSLTFVRKPKEAFMRKEVGGQVVMNWKAYGSHVSRIVRKTGIISR